jgi:hypothetical protein
MAMESLRNGLPKMTESDKVRIVEIAFQKSAICLIMTGLGSERCFMVVMTHSNALYAPIPFAAKSSLETKWAVSLTIVCGFGLEPFPAFPRRIFACGYGQWLL